MAGRKITISDVAQRAGVSKGLVSFALNDRPGVSPESRQRILAIARELGWRPDARGRALSTSRSLAYGLVLNRSPSVLSADSFFPAFISGVERALSELGHVLVLSVVDDPEAELETYRSLLSTGRVDGVFLTDIRQDDPRIALVRELGAHAVIIGDAGRADDIPAMGVEQAAAADQIIGHLAGLGHRRIALVVGPEHMVHATVWRDLLIASMAAWALPEPIVVETDFSAEAGASAMQQLLDDGDPPTAAVFANDHMALAALGYARRRGKDVPHDLSIVGHGDSEMARFEFPALTTVTVDVAEWGSRAAQRLSRHVSGEESRVAPMPPARLQVRESTAVSPR